MGKQSNNLRAVGAQERNRSKSGFSLTCADAAGSQQGQ